jgi:hypothetical protein
MCLRHMAQLPHYFQMNGGLMLKQPIVNISELRRIVDALLTHVEKVHGPEFRLENDYYWDLDSDVMYDMGKTINKVEETGSLGDDWEFLLNYERREHQRGWTITDAHSCSATLALHRRESWRLAPKDEK